MNQQDIDKFNRLRAITVVKDESDFKAKDSKEYEAMLLDFVRKQFEGI